MSEKRIGDPRRREWAFLRKQRAAAYIERLDRIDEQVAKSQGWRERRGSERCCACGRDLDDGQRSHLRCHERETQRSQTA